MLSDASKANHFRPIRSICIGFGLPDEFFAHVGENFFAQVD
jgi:hypothetical protein